MKRLAILSTHPIQYNAPLYRLLAADPQTEVMVFFSKATQATRFDQERGEPPPRPAVTAGFEEEGEEAARAALEGCVS